MTIHEILFKYWKHSAFRSLQEDIIHSILQGKDTLGILPTGGGKSVCFQVPALATEGVCIVITPLIALMKDQVENLKKKDISAAAIFSGMTYNEIDTTLDNCRFGNIKFLYVSPERLKTELFIERLRRMNICFFVVDEAHCISQWGYDFRPSYLDIKDVREIQPGKPILALTATATPQVVVDIQKKLHFTTENVFKKSFERKNLVYYSIEEANKLQRLLAICGKMKGTGIVYVRNRKRTQEVAEFLKTNRITADFYHAGLDAKERDQKQLCWKNDETRIIVCTNAFGMGIDKPNVRFVVHLDLPDSIEAYYQEAGRGGRDEQWAHAILLYDHADIAQLEENFSNSYPTVEQLKINYQAISNFLQIPIGSGEQVTFDFDVEKFIKQYKLSAMLVLNSIQILEQEGYFIFNKDKLLPTRIKILANNMEYYNFEVKNPKLENTMKTILRTYKDVFESYVKINEYDIARNAKKPIEAVLSDLKLLHQLQIIEYLPQSKTTQLTFVQARVDNRNIYINPETYLWRKNQSESRVKAMIHYTSNREKCRSVMLLDYFGEAGKNCRYCDVCLEKNKKEISKEEYQLIKTEILKALGNSAYTLAALSEHLSDFSKTRINECIDLLLDENLICYDAQMMLKIYAS